MGRRSAHDDEPRRLHRRSRRRHAMRCSDSSNVIRRRRRRNAATVRSTGRMLVGWRSQGGGRVGVRAPAVHPPPRRRKGGRETDIPTLPEPWIIRAGGSSSSGTECLLARRGSSAPSGGRARPNGPGSYDIGEAAFGRRHVLVEARHLAIAHGERVNEAVSGRRAVEGSGGAAPCQHRALTFGQIFDTTTNCDQDRRGRRTTRRRLRGLRRAGHRQHVRCLAATSSVRPTSTSGISPLPTDS